MFDQDKHFWLFVAKEILVGLAKIVGAAAEGIFAMIYYPVVCGVMWTINRMGFWHMPTYTDPKGHFKLPW